MFKHIGVGQMELAQIHVCNLRGAADFGEHDEGQGQDAPCLRGSPRQLRPRKPLFLRVSPAAPRSRRVDACVLVDASRPRRPRESRSAAPIGGRAGGGVLAAPIFPPRRACAPPAPPSLARARLLPFPPRRLRSFAPSASAFDVSPCRQQAYAEGTCPAAWLRDPDR